MPLTQATDPTYYSIKAMFVWWMLRDMVGDQPLQRAIQSYRPDQDKEPSYFQQLLQAQSKRDLEWFFDDWVYRDRGLPDFRIATAFVRAMLSDNISVTVTVENLGDVAAEVPVTVHTDKGDATQRVLVKGKSKAVQRFQVISQPTVAVVNDGSVPEIDLANNHYKFPSSPPPQ
jgi:aminopeptidase N